MVGVQEWAEIRRLVLVEGRSQREVALRLGLARDTVAKAVRSETPPRYSRVPAGSKLDPFKDWICEQLREDPTLRSQRLRELAVELGYVGGKTVFDEFVREVRPRVLVRRTFQRTVYRPGELVQCDLWEPRQLIPVGHGQQRRGWVVTAELYWSRAIAGALIFSKEAPDILWGVARCLGRIGALPEKLVWDRRARSRRPAGRLTSSPRSAVSLVSAGSSWTPAMRRRRARLSARTGSCARTSCPAGRSRTRPTSSCSSTVGVTGSTRRVHRTTRAVPVERLVVERERMRPLPARLPDTDRRFVRRVPAQPYLRVDRNDYSLDPAFAGRRVEVRVSQTEVIAAVLDTGEPACRHRRVFAGNLTFTDPARQTELDRQRARRRQRHEVDVEIRPLSRYDALIPA